MTSQDFDSELKTVQRSSSMKEDKLHTKKDRSSERRRTCTPVLRTSSSEPEITDLSATEDPGVECDTLQVGLETVEVVQGKVKKHKRGKILYCLQDYYSQKIGKISLTNEDKCLLTNRLSIM